MTEDSTDSKAVTELKTRARLRRNAAKASNEDLRLRDCLTLVAKDVGFTHWEHARRVLNGKAELGEDMGIFWYAPRCGGLLNQWFANYGLACAALQVTPRRCFLLPYRRQFMVVEDDFVRELGLDPDHEVWEQAARNLTKDYSVEALMELAFLRLKAPAATFSKR